jgi:LmbE family N-acetylglucosaminyl deacetylase
MAMRVLAFGAHPDDSVLLCGGTLAKYARAGDQVFMAVLCNGDCLRRELSGEEATRVLRQELDESARMIGATTYLMGSPDLELEDNPATRSWVIQVLREVDPSVVLTHDPGDYTADHRVTTAVVDRCVMAAGEPKIKTGAPPRTTPVLVLYMETMSGLGFAPEEFVDITEVFSTKREMMQCHKSFVLPLQGHPVVDVMEWIEASARFRGIQAGVRYAEAFRRAPQWARMETQRWLP